jgi:large subunit ribosomal protein L4
MEAKVLDFNGKDTGRKVQLSDSVFGIEPNNHAVYLDVKQYLANQRQGTHKAKESNIIVLEDFNFETPNTKNFINVLKALELDNKKSLFVLGDSNKNVYLSSRNLKASKVITSSELSTYDILNTNSLVLLEGSLELIEENLSK